MSNLQNIEIMRRKIIAGNWKMHKTFPESLEFGRHLNTWMIANKPQADVIIMPAFICLEQMIKDLRNSKISVAAQDVSSEARGAFTGEVSAEQLKSIGVEYSIVGHSERRHFHGETDYYISQKIGLLYEHNMTPILCVGEKIEDRSTGKHFDVVKSQVIGALHGQKPEKLKNLIIAYEPIWAIGTGKTASPDTAQEMHAHIRKILGEEFGIPVGNSASILYGGSVNAGNARDLFQQYDIDGALVGGASLNLEDFTTIINARN